MKSEEPEVREDEPHFSPLFSVLGAGLLLCSSTLLYFSTQALLGPDDGNNSVLFMLGARMCGIGAFCIGVYSIFHQRWTLGVLLLLGSIVLPFISLFVHGTI